MVAPTSFFLDYGCHVRILEEVRALQKLGHQVTVITYYLGRDLPDLEIVRTRPTPWRAANAEKASMVSEIKSQIELGCFSSFKPPASIWAILNRSSSRSDSEWI